MKQDVHNYAFTGKRNQDTNNREDSLDTRYLKMYNAGKFVDSDINTIKGWNNGG